MRRAFTIWQFLLLIAVLIILAAILFPIFARKPEPHRSGCQSNLKNIGLVFQQYFQDYNEKFPVVVTGGSAFGWVDAFQPYIKSTEVFQCSSEGATRPTDLQPRAIGYTDYWMNTRLAGKNQSLLNATSLTILDGDGNDGRDATDARYALDSIPEAWKGNKSSPLYRHLDGANNGFADGHVQWFQASKMTVMNPSGPTNAGLPTFSMK